jgi:tyrosyl-tRNA synthetase
MSGLLEELRERGFIQDLTDEPALSKLLAAGPLTAYAGFDPTAPSFHVGNLVTILLLVHLQRSGHRPIAVIGGGTGMVGDPSGKQEMRQLLGKEEISSNLERFRDQLARLLRFEAGKALILDNAEWLAGLNYIQFLREVGRHFSVNRMLTAECFKTRLDSEAGLSFLEFNYMLLQAYDFLWLHRAHGCRLQVGGSDQWGNIVAGIDLIRRVEGGEAYGLTTPLVMTAGGAKMGKTAAGAVWLSAERTSPYDFYQYWINTDDRDVGRFLRLFTFLSLAEIRELERLQGAEIRQAKEVLAFEVTRMVHGEEESGKARQAARALFGGGDGKKGTGGEGGGAVPARKVPRQTLQERPLAVNLFADFGLCASRAEARRLARQGGLYINGQPIAEDRVVGDADVKDGAVHLRSGKKRHLLLEVE